MDIGRARYAALDVYTRDQRPQEWADIQAAVGDALAEEGRRATGPERFGPCAQRTGLHYLGAQSIALFGQAAAAFRSALAVDARRQLPLAWAPTQTNLGHALVEQGEPTAGAPDAELMAQAAAAFRSALEVYTPEAFPADHQRVQEKLAKTEELLTAKDR